MLSNFVFSLQLHPLYLTSHTIKLKRSVHHSTTSSSNKRDIVQYSFVRCFSSLVSSKAIDCFDLIDSMILLDGILNILINIELHRASTGRIIPIKICAKNMFTVHPSVFRRIKIKSDFR